MNSTLRNLLLIGLFVATVAAVTLISQFSVTPTVQSDVTLGPDGEPAPAGPPLAFRDATMFFDPASENIAQRSFAGYFEVGATVHWVSFWFKNPNPFPVRLTMKARSCTSCTSAKVAVVPPDFVGGQAGFAAAAALPWSPVPLPDLLSPVGYARHQNQLAWHVFDFDRPDSAFTVPPAAGPDRPTVGVLALGFTAKAVGPPNPVYATAEASGPDEKIHAYPFQVAFAPRPAFDLYPGVFQVGDLPEGAPPRTFDAFIYSTTRKPGDLPPPVGLVGDNDPFLTLGPPVPITAAETELIAQRVSEETQGPIRVQSGYRIPVVVHRDVPSRLPEIGAFEKTVHFSIPRSEHTIKGFFRGRVTGLVKLEDGEKIELGSYPSEFATRKTAEIYTDRKDLELELDSAQCRPTFVQYALDGPRLVGSRKYWSIKVSIPAKQGRKPAWEGVVFLRAKAPDGTKANIRLPVTGSGIGR